MKTLLSILMLIAAIHGWAGEKPAASQAAASIVKGEVLEVKDAESYTYLRLKTKEGETWAAVSKSPVKTGMTVTLENAIVMNNFESRSLKKTFPTIVFGTLAGTGSGVQGSNAISTAHAGMTQPAETRDIHVPKASGANAKTVAEIITKAAELKDKPVLVRGKIVKYNPGILGKNWIHLRDGSGSATDGTNDVLVTSTNEVKLGDTVTAKGVVRTDRDFGAGYVYKVIIEDATFQQ